MEDGRDSGYPSPRDELPKTSTPIRSGKKPSLREHFSGVDVTLGLENDSHAETGRASIPKSKPSLIKADEGIRNAINAERNSMVNNKLERSRVEEKENHHRIQNLEFDLVGAKKSYTEAQDEIRKKEEIVKHLQEQLKDTTENKNEIEAELVEVKKSCSEAEDEIIRKEELIKQLQEQIHNIIVTKEELESSMVRTNKSYAEAQSEVNKKERLIDQLKQQLNDITGNMKKLESDLAESKKLHVEAQNELKTKENLIMQLRQRISELQNSLLQVEPYREKYNNLEKIHNELKMDLKHKIDTHTITCGRIEQLQNERDNLEKDIGLLQEKQKTFLHNENGLRKELELLRDTNKKLVLMNAELNDANSIFLQRLDELQQDYTSLTEKYKTAEADKESYAGRLNDFDSVNKLNEELQKKLAECQLRVVELEKQLPNLLSENNKISTELCDIKRRNHELESVNEHYARKEVEASSEIQLLQKSISGKQKENQHLLEEIEGTKKKLEEAKAKVKHLDDAVAKDSQVQKTCAELEMLNMQLTNEIEYLRSKTREQPSLEEHRQINEKLDNVTAELKLKERQLKTMEEKNADLNHMLSSSKNMQLELDKSSTIIKQQGAEMAKLKMSYDLLRDDLNEKCESNAKLIAEFDGFKEIKENEIKHYVAKFNEAEENCGRLQSLLQREIQLRTLSSAGSTSSVWEWIPEDIRLQLPEDSEDVLKSIKIKRVHTSSFSDKRDNGSDEFPSKLASFLEKYAVEKVNVSDVVYSILNLTSMLLRRHANSIESFVPVFSSEMSQIIEKLEKKYILKISELEQLKIEESKDRREYQSRAHDLENDLDSVKNTNSMFQNQLAVSKSELAAKTKIIQTRDNVIAKLKEELQELIDVRMQLQQEVSDNQKLIKEMWHTVTEYKNDTDQYQENEERLQEQIRGALSEAEHLKREKTDLETDCHSLSLENETVKRKLKDLEQKDFCIAQELGDCKKKLAYEERAKRYNQETMRKCFVYIDQYKDAIEHLKQRNWQRQKVLDKIAGDLDSLCSQKSYEVYKKLLGEKCPKWKKDDEELNNHLEKLCDDFNKTIRERTTSEVNAAFKEIQQNNNRS